MPYATATAQREKATDVKLVKFRALLTLDPAGPQDQPTQYPSGTHSLMVRFPGTSVARHWPCFAAAIYRVDEQPLRRGDAGVVVTVELAGDDACAGLRAGQPFTVWNGADIGHGVISRRVVFTSAI
ncbi:MAG TPA: hypothetical protein VFV41_20170 [Streptosporangiaceae bacterium]|nr:hypothetical protein [Streptosporangiaceae bacterium]